MGRITWDAVGERRYESGLDRGVLYVKYLTSGVAWNGLVSVNESSSGGEIVGFYLDGRKYVDTAEREDFQATIEAITYPDEFTFCEGYSELAVGLFATRQSKRSFDLCYRTMIGNDVEGEDAAYKLHLIYNATAGTSGRNRQTRTNQPGITNFSWSIEAFPPFASLYRPTAHFVIDSRDVDREFLDNLEAVLYGTETSDSRMPLQSEVIAILGGALIDVEEFIIDGGSSTNSPSDIYDGGSSYVSPSDIVDGGRSNKATTPGGGGEYPNPGTPNPNSGIIDGGDAESPGVESFQW